MSGWKDCTSRADSEPQSYAAKPIMHDIYGKLSPYITESFIVKFNPCMSSIDTSSTINKPSVSELVLYNLLLRVV